MTNTNETYEVVVAGAGPVGLMLAGELALRGVRTLVVERLTEPSTTVKAGSLNTPTVEAAYRRGLLPQLAYVQEQTFAVMSKFFAERTGANPADGPAVQPPKPLGHFAGIWLTGAERLDGTDPDLEPNPATGVVMVSQQALEAILGAWLTELGVEVRRGAELVGLTDDGAGVSVELAGGQQVRGEWLVGCDGGRSVVRKLTGFDFPGTEPTITGHQAIVDIADPEKLTPGWQHSERGMLVFGPAPGRILTVEYEDGPPADRDEPITLAELQTSLRNVSGTDVTITGVSSSTRFTDHARQAADYRKGRVLLAGDAAHVHSPFGGQGLNLGVGDAVNLGWKLAATINGWAPAGLLDTYTAERHPVGAWVLDWNRAQVALMRPDVQTTALRAVVGDLLDTAGGLNYAVKKLSGVWINYDLGDGHRLVGKRTPDLEFTDGTRLGEHCGDGRAVLVDQTGAFAEIAAAWSDRVAVLGLASVNHPELAGLLVRPDGYVAWAADSANADPQGLTEALTRWFGASAGAPAVVGASAGHAVN